MGLQNKYTILVVALMIMSNSSIAQQEEMEDIAESAISHEQESQQDINEMHGTGFIKKYNINSITETMLENLFFLKPNQVKQFILYRKNFGDFISLMELQAVPDWDPFTIRKILPLLTLETELPLVPAIKQRIKEGGHRLLYRTGGQSIKTNENQDTLSHQYKQLVSYRFNFRDLLRWGITVEKDAGEKSVADHYSLFASISKKGILKNMVLGDYTVNMGQGLIHWQGYALGRSSNMMSAFRQGALFRPHTGTDENRFCRGIAVQLQKNALELAAFVSNKKIDANIITDTATNKAWASSLLLSGLHRTKNELMDKKALQEFIVGASMKVNSKIGRTSLNIIQTVFDHPIKKREAAYNRFAISGRQWQNASIDHAVSTRIGFLFGEMAMDKKGNRAMIAGLIKSLAPSLDMALLYRNMGVKFRSLASNAFSERQESGNEKGFFFNINYMPNPRHRFEIFADQYQQDWPTFSTPGKKMGNIYSFQYTYRPNKKTEMYGRIQSDNNSLKLRIHASFMPLPTLTCRLRNEMIKIQSFTGKIERGQFAYLELIYKPPLAPFSASIRCSFFDTDGYATRIYAYERDLPAYYAVPPHYGEGTRAYLVVQYKLGKSLQCAGKWSMDKKKNEWRVQVIWQWGS
jgi:DNA uptake protein ComE-like DNA-binding protein